ncbi:P3 protein precursor [Danio rerio]|uniref:P3 protein precursor n=1 Tax=Danio rerio TaxID=7955 RepID=Q6NUT8_DANRE|nr:P3 protein precursor [Danio rerio]AAH68432.1 Zgc:85947 [Danio rerio]|eukprot:NP_999905.1 P3 protein precursor [Danio rerio]
MKTALVFLCLLFLTCAGDPDHTEPRTLQYLRIGDGSAREFQFPQNTRGVIVISSQYRSSGGRKGRDSLKQTLRVRSLDPDVISILNVSDSGPQSSYTISIRSGLPGTAPLLLQLLELSRDAEPLLIEERSDYSIRVEAAPEHMEAGGLQHFSENPVLFALLPLIFVNKCAFGCKVEVEVLLALLRRPVPLLLGVAAQFLLMPLYAFALSQLAALPTALALGLVITCSAPGGGGGYLYSLLLGGDVTLAICMTLVSTVVATAAMPLSSALYGRLLGVHAALHVPFVKILGTLLFIAIPISLGLLVKLRVPAVASVLLALIRPFSFVLIVGGIFMAYQMGSSILAHVRAPMVVVGVTVPVFGLLAGLALARLAGLASPQRRTVGIEVGVQNSLLALAVMQLSFQRAEADYASQAPFIVALSSTSEMLLLVLAHIARSRLCPPAPATRTLS